jgi:hypothetical protein
LHEKKRGNAMACEWLMQKKKSNDYKVMAYIRSQADAISTVPSPKGGNAMTDKTVMTNHIYQCPKCGRMTTLELAKGLTIFSPPRHCEQAMKPISEQKEAQR